LFACLFTATQLQSQAAIANASMQSATTSLSNANTAYQNSLSTAISSFQSCALQEGFLLAPFYAVGCGASLASNAVSSISSAVTTALQSFTQVLGLSANSFSATVTPMVNSTVQQIQQTFQAASNQAANIAQQSQACISQAANATAANANATAANANATAANANATAANATATAANANATTANATAGSG
jgi:hypothetical protein